MQITEGPFAYAKGEIIQGQLHTTAAGTSHVIFTHNDRPSNPLVDEIVAREKYRQWVNRKKSDACVKILDSIANYLSLDYDGCEIHETQSPKWRRHAEQFYSKLRQDIDAALRADGFGDTATPAAAPPATDRTEEALGAFEEPPAE